MPICHRGDNEIFYATRGQGEPLLFLNGLCGDHLYWTSQLRRFSKQFLCLGPDNRDVGQSSYYGAKYTIEDLADDSAHLLRELGCGPARVVGLSMGGMIAQSLAIRHPELITSLMLVDTAAYTDSWFAGTLHAFELIRRQAGDTPSFFDAILPWWVSPKFMNNNDRTSWLRWSIRQNPHPQKLEGFLNQIHAIGSFDIRDQLKKIRCPVLVLVGEDDMVLPPRYSQEISALIAHAELVVLPEVGHAVPIENPGEFNAQIRQFMNLGKGGPSS